MSTYPDLKQFVGKNVSEAPMSLQRIAARKKDGERFWIGPEDAKHVLEDEAKAYDTAHKIMMRLCIEAPIKHKSGHPGGPLSAFTFAYEVTRRRDPASDESLRFSPGHLSLLGFPLQWFFGRDGDDARLASPQAIMDTFRTIGGLPGHVEAGIGDIPFGTGPLGKGVSNALGVAFAKKYLKKSGIVDVVLADGDSQEGQVAEAFRLASLLGIDNLVVHGDWNDIQLAGIPSSVVGMGTDLASVAVALGWAVIEVQNGNDLRQVRAALDQADLLAGKGRPIFVCYYTTMGDGVPLMEQGSNSGKKNFHGSPLSADDAKTALDSLHLPSLADLTKAFEPVRAKHKKRFDAARAKRSSARLAFTLPASYKRILKTEPGAARSDFGAIHIKALMAGDSRIVVLHADLAGSGGFSAVEKDFPDRVINVGVAEANMYMMAAGMRQAGLLPVTYTFAAFGVNEARANARLIDINTGHIPLGVLHDCTHAGLSVGEDGETHQERNYVNIPFDYTQVWVIGDSNQAGAMAERAMQVIAAGTESVYVFSARTGHPQILTAEGKALYGSAYVFDGRASLVRGTGDSKDDATILSYGSALHEAVKAADLLLAHKRSIRVLNMACIRPMDAGAVLQAALETGHLIVAEDHNTEGGLASQVADLLADLAVPCTLRRIGVRHFLPSGPSEQLTTLVGLDAEDIANTVEDQFAYRLAGGEEAFVAFLYALKERLPHTRFGATAESFIARLRNDAEYMESLRLLWKGRSYTAKLPTSQELLAQLPVEGVFTDVNPLTGILRAPQHDPGII
ncbi:MAG: transketolase C-terminal domain-containing protein [Candidatus Peribacteraceae bacterium]|nr:transketolase C-terminal domain-containing protein [Candidatus Peribacteraceae bacterium]